MRPAPRKETKATQSAKHRLQIYEVTVIKVPIRSREVPRLREWTPRWTNLEGVG